MQLSATTLIGDSVRNAQGEDLGTIEDLMIDVNDGTVDYAVLSFGGFLGMGDKFFAVPLETMQVDTDQKCVVLNVDKDRLENAPGFDKDNWPDMANDRWHEEIHNYYNVPLNRKAS